MSAPVNMDRRTVRREETKAEIVAAAWELVREHGLAGLSMRDLGERVGMKAQSLYSYFDSKLEIYDAMFLGGYEAFAQATASLWPDDTDRTASADHEASAEAIRSAAHLYFEFSTADPVRYQLLFQRTIPDFVPSAESYALAVQVLDRMTAWLAELGLTDPTAIDLWTALLTGLASQQIANDPGGERWERVVDPAVDMFLAVNDPYLVDPPTEGHES